MNERETALMNLARLGMSDRDARRLRRLGATLSRLAEAKCNGDYPSGDSPNGARKGARPCGAPRGSEDESIGCGSWWVPAVLSASRGYLCPDCRAYLDAKALAAQYGLKAVVQGDPRGMVLGVCQGSVSDADIDSGRVRAVFVA